MDLAQFRSILKTSGVDVWEFMEMAVTVASLDHNGDVDNFKRRRASIVERLYTTTTSMAPLLCQNCDAAEKSLIGKDENNVVLDEDRNKKILDIKKRLGNPKESGDSLVELLENLADMNLTYQELDETKIGRPVNRLSRRSSNEKVRILAEQLVNKWRDVADEYSIKLNENTGKEEVSSTLNDHQVQNGSSSESDKCNSEQQQVVKLKPKEAVVHNSVCVSDSTPSKREKQEEESERLACARSRLRQNCMNAENAKRQRTIKVMDIQELPKPIDHVLVGKKKDNGIPRLPRSY